MPQIPNSVLSEACIPRAFWEADGDKVRLNKKDRMQVVNWLYNDKRKSLLCIRGDTQTGKTSLACLLLMMFYRNSRNQNSYTIGYVTLPDLVRSFFDRDRETVPYMFYESCQMLVIDELAGHGNSGHSQVLEQLLKKRMNDLRPTILCESVFDEIGQIEKDYGGELSRRISLSSLNVQLEYSDAY